MAANMRILIATDAWFPQVNGVVRVLDTTARHLAGFGHEVAVIGPDRFLTLPAPGYPEVRLAIAPGRQLARLIRRFRPEAIHIPVEGPIGWAARRFCMKRRIPFTTSFHTRFGHYFHSRWGFGERPATFAQRRFHAPGAALLVQTDTLERRLASEGFHRIGRWDRAVDTELFRPGREDPAFDPDFLRLPRPIFLYLGRVSLEKNLPAFLDLRLPGSKVVVGDGPALGALRARFPGAHFLGARHGPDLARHLSAADAFVFPSRFETFGLVVLEALACGTPVAAFPVPGPLDIVGGARHVAVLSDDLGAAALAALQLDRRACRRFAETFSWERCTRQFEAALAPIPASAWR